MAEQGPPPPRSSGLPTAGRRGGGPRETGRSATGRRYWEEPDDNDDDEAVPPWAGPGVTPRWAGQEPRQRRAHARTGTAAHAGSGDARVPAGAVRDDGHDRPGAEPSPGSRRRRAAARSRRRSRVTWVWGVAGLVVVLIVAGVVFMLGRHQPAPASQGGFVTTFQRGELKTVPDSCTAVTSATLNRYLPGKRRMVVPRSLDGNAQSLCNWTLDAPPVYRVLEVNVQAYAPSGLATGNGSATNAAIDAYAQAMATMRHPARATHLPPATIIPLHQLGTAAFAALQIVRARPDPVDLETVVARDHNVIITVVMQGPHARSGRYQAAPQAELQSGALTAATDIVNGLR